MTYWLTADGEIERQAHRRARVEGSWSGVSSVEVHACPIFDGELARACERKGMGLTYLRVDGNPQKWFQPHNVMGSPAVYDLACDFVPDLMKRAGLPGRPLVSRAYLNRVDACLNFDLGRVADAASFVRELSRHASVSHRRASGFETSLLFPGRRSSLSVYHKGPELRAHPGAFCPDWLLALADRLVRFEVVNRSERLEELGLRRLISWRADSVGCLWSCWSSFVERLRFPVMSTVELVHLSRGAGRLYAIWASGMDVNQVVSRATVYRYRLEILRAGGPDIALPKPGSPVVEFQRVLRPVLASPPDELKPYIYHPRHAA